MYSGELEVQAKRKAIAVLQDEINRILNASRELASHYRKIWFQINYCFATSKLQDATKKYWKKILSEIIKSAHKQNKIIYLQKYPLTLHL